MNILYLGDIMAEPGIEIIEQQLPKLRKELVIDLVIAQAENVSEGKGITVGDFGRLLRAGVDFCTGGNHTLTREEIIPYLNDKKQPIIRPANYPRETPGEGTKYIDTPYGKVLVVSLLGKIVGKDAERIVDNPLHIIDDILVREKKVKKAATIVNLHGDFSSEKVVIGNYLDGRVSMVVGDHWHVPTADARVLPGGTAHITDVGMCGILNSSLGVTYQSITARWRDNVPTRNIMETAGPRQVNGLLVTIDPQTQLATHAELLRRIYE